MKTKGIFLLGAIALLFLSARREKAVVYDMKYVEENMIYIPKMSFNTGPSDEDVDTPYNTTTRSQTVSVDSFYLCRYEMTNGMYCYYLRELLKTKSKAGIAQYNKALPDTLVWREKFAYNEPYVEYYLRHPAYANYPVVGVNYGQAMEFCNWLTKTYNAWPDRKYKKVKFDLPSRNQWIGAAHGNQGMSIFPWEGYQMMNKDGKWMANFAIIDQSSVYRKTVPEINVYGNTIDNTYLVGGARSHNSVDPCWGISDNGDITVSVKSFYPNGYGLYNMAGNVEEMIKEKGFTKGGSWRDPGYYLQNQVEEIYTDSTATSSERGFRVMMQLEN
jgi:sulfatase modifying factor 1